MRPFSILTFRHRLHAILHGHGKICPNWTIGEGDMTSYHFFQDGGHCVEI